MRHPKQRGASYRFSFSGYQRPISITTFLKRCAVSMPVFGE